MAFMGRGDRPSIGDNNTSNCQHGGPFLYSRFYYYIPLDNTYVIMELIATFIILIVGAITFLMTYKSTIIDPIENIKKLFINAHLIVIAIFLAITLVVNLFSKKESELISRLILTAITSIVIMMFFAGTKFYLDKTYTKTEFEKIYTEQNANKIDSKKTKVGIGLAGVNIKTEKEYYVDECVKLYNIFKTKSYGTLGLHLLLNLLLIYQIFKVEKIQNKKERLDKDDIILKDEEQNVKY